MEIRQLKTFVMIARLGSFTKAADVLGYVQSALTAQVQNLEEELGTVLFERFGRQIKLTRDGENLLFYAQQILHLAEAAKCHSSALATGTIAIGTSESVCLHHLTALLKEYRTRCPQVELKLHFGTCCELHSLLANNVIDLAFLLDDPIVDDKLIVHNLFDETVLFLASPQHPLTRFSRVTPEDFINQTMILTESGCCFRTRYETFMKERHIQPSSVLEVSSVEIIKRFTRDNLGICLLAKSTAAAELAAGDLVALHWDGPAIDVKAQLIHHKEKQLSTALQSFIDLSLEKLKVVDQ